MDHVECGMTQELTVELMADFVKELNMGGLKGLKSLWSGELQSKSDVAAAFTALKAALERALSDDERERMGVGPVMIEHSLCKLGRMDTALFVTIGVSWPPA
jgi:hypothetical protein